jgi:hypothetical protein
MSSDIADRSSGTSSLVSAGSTTDMPTWLRNATCWSGWQRIDAALWQAGIGVTQRLKLRDRQPHPSALPALCLLTGRPKLSHSLSHRLGEVSHPRLEGLLWLLPERFEH